MYDFGKKSGASVSLPVTSGSPKRWRSAWSVEHCGFAIGHAVRNFATRARSFEKHGRITRLHVVVRKRSEARRSEPSCQISCSPSGNAWRSPQRKRIRAMELRSRPASSTDIFTTSGRFQCTKRVSQEMREKPALAAGVDETDQLISSTGDANVAISF